MSASLNSILGTIIACAVIGAVTVLTWHHSIDGQAAVGIFGALIGGGVVVGAHSIASSTSK